MTEKNEQPNMLPILQAQCRWRKGGMSMNIKNTDSEIVDELPKYLQLHIKAGGTVIIDLAGNINLISKPISK